MDAIGFVAIGVLVAGILVGAVLLRRPPDWGELGGQSPLLTREEAEAVPTVADDAAALRALVAAKRARRLAAGQEVASDTRAPGAPGAPWAHLDAEVVEEARALVARRARRLAAAGEPVAAEQDELQRLLGPPYP